MSPNELANLSDDELNARIRALYPRTEEPGCPREVALEYFAMSDERRRRRPFDLQAGSGCMDWRETVAPDFP